MARVQWMLGAGAVLILLALHLTGATAPLEYAAVDQRMRHFQSPLPPMRDDVVLVLIDDSATETLGRWPWPRSMMATLTDELTRAGASVIAFDILFDEPQAPELRADPEGSGGVRRVDHDSEFAAALARSGRSVLASSFAFSGETLGHSTVVRDDGSKRSTFRGVFDLLSTDRALTTQQLLRVLLPEAGTSGAPVDDLEHKRDAALAVLELAPGSSDPVPAGAARWPVGNEPSPPTLVLALASGRIASVSFGGGDSDGDVRRIPLWHLTGDRLWPTLGLAAAAAHLGVPLSSIDIEGAERTTIAESDGSAVSLPMDRGALRQLASQKSIDGLMMVCWPKSAPEGDEGWRGRFTRADADEPSVVNVGRVLDPVYTVYPAIARSLALLDQNVFAVAPVLLDPATTEAYRARASLLQSVTPDDPGWRPTLDEQRPVWAQIVDSAAFAVEGLPPDSELTEAELADVRALRGIAEAVPAQIAQLDAGLERVRAWRDEELPARVGGKVCFIGWSATGAAADFVGTSVDSITPGVAVHAAVANSILSATDGVPVLRPAPWWADALAILFVGAFAIAAAVLLDVAISPLFMLAFLALWVAFDGVVLWGSLRQVVALSTPLLAGFAGWLAVMLHRLFVEQRGRRRTEARFRSYVPPDVVDILVNNPSLDSMAPQKRELTIMFSDIAGFTTLSERLGVEGTSRLLSTYLGAMTDVLQATRATLDKYLGDGIMAFWGAPLDDPQHAEHAAEATVRMFAALEEMNASGAFGADERLVVRVGLAAGEVNVGDFGNPPAKSAYTVIGDAVNLAARLESANKQMGTSVLVNRRVRELVGDRFRVRPIGRVVVKGKKQFETLYELIGDRLPKGDRTEAWIQRTEEGVNAFLEQKFDICLDLMDTLESEFGDSALAEVYRRAVALAKESGEPFQGTIVLTEK